MGLFEPFRRCMAMLVLLGSTMAACDIAFAQDGVVPLEAQVPLGRNIDAFSLPSGRSAALDRIRDTLAVLNKAALRAAAECRRDAAAARMRESDWSRSVSVTMAGPRLLSFLVGEDAACGGPHPDETSYAVVFDLQTGRQLDWLAILPAAMAAKQGTDRADDGLVVAGVRSARLHGILLGADAVGELPNGDCDLAPPTGNDDAATFVLYPDAATHSLAAMQTGLPHGTQACGLDRSLPVAILRADRFPAWLADAVEQAAPVPAGLNPHGP